MYFICSEKLYSVSWQENGQNGNDVGRCKHNMCIVCNSPARQEDPLFVSFVVVGH